MSKADSKEPAKGKDKDEQIAKVEEGEEAEAKRGWMRWAFGWVVVPGSILGGIWLAGVLVGAHFSESWFSRAVVWTIDVFR